MAADVPYTRAPIEVGDGVWAYLQPDGGWGRSNAGLIGSGDGAASLLVDTLFDLESTAAMLAALRAVAPAAERSGTVVNTPDEIGITARVCGLSRLVTTP